MDPLTLFVGAAALAALLAKALSPDAETVPVDDETEEQA